MKLKTAKRIRDCTNGRKRMQNRPPSDYVSMIQNAMAQCPFHVRGGDHNVVLGSHKWVREIAGQPVSPVGAWLLVVQPDPDDDDCIAAPDPLHAAAHAMGCPPLWLEGVTDGFEHQRPDANRLAQWEPSDPLSQQYMDGVRWGRQIKQWRDAA